MDALRALDAPSDLAAPRPRTAAPADDDAMQALERLVASIADLVLKASALAERYDRQLAVATAEADERVHRLRQAAARGQVRLQELLAVP